MMFKTAFASFSLVELPIFSMALFMLVFAAVMVRVFLRANPVEDAARAQLPLGDGDRHV